MRRLIVAMAVGLRLAAQAGEIPPVPLAPAALYAEPTTKDHIGCVAAPVYINGLGPFRFVIDTASNRTLLSPRLASLLQIDLAGLPSLVVNGINGSQPAPVARLQSMRIGKIVAEDFPVLVIENHVHPEADGLLGADSLAGHRLMIDFRHNRVDIFRAGEGRANGFDMLDATMQFGLLPMVEASIGHIDVTAIIDTGGEVSLGNGALWAALNERKQFVSGMGLVDVSGIVGPDITTKALVVTSLTMGPFTLRHMPLLFGNPQIFELWGLQDRPAIVIGMDVLGRYDAIGIDYDSQRVLFKFPG